MEMVIITGIAILIGFILIFRAAPCQAWFDFVFRYSLAEAASIYHSRFGKLYTMRICGATAHVTTDKTIIHHIMKRNARNYLRRPGDTYGLSMINMLDKGIIWNQDLNKFHSGRRIFERSLKDLERICNISNKVGKQWCMNQTQILANKEELELDMADLAGSLTFQITLRAFFGVDSLGHAEDAAMRSAIKKYFEAWEHFLVKPWWFKLLFPSAHRQNMAKVENIQKLVKEMVKRVDGKSSFVSSLKEKGFGDSEIVQLSIEMLLAGADTSSWTLYYTLVILSKRPKDLRRLREELETKSDMTMKDCNELKFMDAYLKESMRVKPVGPMILRSAVNDDEIEMSSGLLGVTRGTHFFLNIKDYNLDPSVFPAPHVFNPKRFINGNGNEMAMSFGLGPKSCVGRHMAMREIKVLLAHIIQRFDFTTQDRIELLETKWDIANHPIKPASFHFTLRKERTVVFTGPHGTGKTTLMKKVISKGEFKFRERCEGARPLAKLLAVKQSDFSDFNDKAVQFQKNILERFLTEDATSIKRRVEGNTEGEANPVWLLDRFAVDPLCYLRWKRPAEYASYMKRCPDLPARLRKMYGHALVLLLEPNEITFQKSQEDDVRMKTSLPHLKAFFEVYKEVLEDIGLDYQIFPFSREWKNATKINKILN